jgi:hypothetical protein
MLRRFAVGTPHFPVCALLEPPFIYLSLKLAIFNEGTATLWSIIVAMDVTLSLNDKQLLVTC